MTKKSLIKEWNWQIKHSNYLWKDAAIDIKHTISKYPLRKAVKILKTKRKKIRGMAISGYYNRAAKDITRLLKKRKR